MNIVINNSDLILKITDYLNDNDSFSLFITDKLHHDIINKYPHKYTIKRTVLRNQRRFFKYRVDKYLTDKNEYPPLVNIIEYRHQFNTKIQNIPKGTKVLKFGFYFNQNIDDMDNKDNNNSLESLSTLIFGVSFNNIINKYPQNIRNIAFGMYYNRPIINLPPNIKCICLGANYNLSLHLPNTVTHLALGFNYNYPLINLPSSLLYLKLGYKYKHDLCNLPPNLEELVLNTNYKKPLLNLPKSLKKVTIGYDYKHPLPLNLIVNYNDLYYFCETYPDVFKMVQYP